MNNGNAPTHTALSVKQDLPKIDKYSCWKIRCTRLIWTSVTSCFQIYKAL
jgi:hypothetical protein